MPCSHPPEFPIPRKVIIFNYLSQVICCERFGPYSPLVEVFNPKSTARQRVVPLIIPFAVRRDLFDDGTEAGVGIEAGERRGHALRRLREVPLA
jgi:hypothetical protein